MSHLGSVICTCGLQEQIYPPARRPLARLGLLLHLRLLLRRSCLKRGRVLQPPKHTTATTAARLFEARREETREGVMAQGQSGNQKMATPGNGNTAQPVPVPLTGAQFKEYNRMAQHMTYFHNHFRQVWTMMYDACENKTRPAGMSMRQFLNEGLHFTESLTAHHSIEESYVFPMLAGRMPEFQQPGKERGGGQSKGSAKAAKLVQQHHEIHAGMDGFEDYLRRCLSGETELELSTLKAQMDKWGKVLWQHLDDEVAALGAENMRKYWSLDEMRRMRM